MRTIVDSILKKRAPDDAASRHASIVQYNVLVLVSVSCFWKTQDFSKTPASDVRNGPAAKMHR